MSGKTVQFLLLPLSPAVRRFEQTVIKAFIEARLLDSKPCKYVERELTVMSPSFYKLNHTNRFTFEPLHELTGE